MPPNLASGSFRIVSLTEGHPSTGVDHSKPGQQFVRLGLPVSNWVLKKRDDQFRLSIGGYSYAGVADGKVIASINARDERKWHATYHELQDAYTIELADDHSKGWTVPGEFAEHPEIEVNLIIVQPSEPPRHLTSQLFRLIPVDE